MKNNLQSSGRVHTYLETGQSSFLSGFSDLKTGCAETNFDSQLAIDDSGLRVPWTKKMCPGQYPRYLVHDDRIPKDHRYVEFDSSIHNNY
jgi:hypothetical protein